MNNKRFAIFLLSLLLDSFLCSGVYSQNGFVFRYSTPDDEYPNSVIEISNGGYIVSISKGSYPLNYHTLLIRLNHKGDSINTLLINDQPGTCEIKSLIKLDNGKIMGLGLKKSDSNTARFWVLIMTDSLTVVYDTTYPVVYSNCWNLLGFIDHSNKVIAYGDASLPGEYFISHPFVFKLGQSGDSLESNFYNNPYSQIVYSMMEKSDSSGYLMSINGSMNSSAPSTFSQFVTMDYNFNITQLDSVPGKLMLYMNTKYINTHSFIMTGLRLIEYSNPRTDKIEILTLDSAFHINKEVFLGPDDTVTYPAYNTNLDFLDVGNIYIGGINNQDWSGIFSYNKSYIIIGKYDSTLNIKWQKSYGGDTYYMVWSVIATTDGGCIIGASINDYSTMGDQRDVYILKVDSNGLITGINQPPTNTGNKTLVYPNPGQHLLNIETQQENLVFHLIDLMGREVCNKHLIPGKNVMQVQNINAGIYIYKVVRNSQMMECGKWIKE